MTDQETLKGQLNLLDTFRRRLRVQLEQQSILGAFAPPYIRIEIDDAQKQIRKIKAYLRQNGVRVEDAPEDGDQERSSSTTVTSQPQTNTTTPGIADVFISYHPADRVWVRGELLPQLDRAQLSYIVDYRDFEIGVPKIVNMERAVERSRHTLIIVTPDWLDSDWNNFQGLLATSADPASVERKLLPLILKKPDKLPGRIAYLEPTDLTDSNERAFQMEKLIRSLQTSRSASVNDLPTRRPSDKLPSQSSGAITTADFVIITALPEERDAVLSKLTGFRRLAPARNDIRVYYTAKVPVTFSDDTTGLYDVVVTTLLGMGRLQAIDAVSAAIYRWKPRYVLMVGIAGGVAEAKVKIGDILISNQIVDYELQKLTDAGPQIRWEVHRADPALLAAVSDFPYSIWKDQIAIARPGEGTPTQHVGPIASGDKVIAFKDALGRYRDTWPKLIGVEMEAAGVATAAFQATDPPGFFMIRGVSDLADSKKGGRAVEKWRAYACDVAAAYTIALLKSGPVPEK